MNGKRPKDPKALEHREGASTNATKGESMHENQSTMLPHITAALSSAQAFVYGWPNNSSIDKLQLSRHLNDARNELDAVKGILCTVLENLEKGSGTIICRAIADLYTVVGARR